jgi:hypothetical protein
MQTFAAGTTVQDHWITTVGSGPKNVRSQDDAIVHCDGHIEHHVHSIGVLLDLRTCRLRNGRCSETKQVRAVRSDN